MVKLPFVFALAAGLSAAWGCTANVEDPTVNQQGRGGDTCVTNCDTAKVTCVGKCTDDACKVSCESTHKSCVTSCASAGSAGSR
jgi:hypothetical protein